MLMSGGFREINLSILCIEFHITNVLIHLSPAFFISVPTRNEKLNSTPRTYPEARGQWSNSVCVLSPGALEEGGRGFESFALYVGRQ